MRISEVETRSNRQGMSGKHSRLCKVSTQTAEVSQVATWNQRFGMWWSQDFPEVRDIARFPDSTAITSEIWDQSWNFQGFSC